MWEILGVFGVALVGGALPLFAKGSDRFLHGCLALSTGIFLAAVFLHLLPEMSTLSDRGHESESVRGHDAHGHDDSGHNDSGHDGHEHDDAEHNDPGNDGHQHGDLQLWAFVLVGVLGVYFMEALLFRHGHMDDVQHHRNVGYAALFGLSLHAFTAGLALPAAAGHERIAGAMFLAIMVHKGFETFALCSVFQLAQFTRSRLLFLLLLFSAVTPLGMLVGEVLISVLGERGQGVTTALAAGTFLYVCLCELLPEVFHRREDTLLKLCLLGAGIAAMAAVPAFCH